MVFDRFARSVSAWAGSIAILATPPAAAAAAGRTAGRIDACKLVSAAEAGKIFGAAMTAKPLDRAATGAGAASICRYATGGAGGGGFMLLAGRAPYGDAGREVARREKEALADTPPGLTKPSFKPVKGLGDAAYLAETPWYFQLHVLAHGAVLVLNVNRHADAESVSRAERVAAVALRRLR